GGIGSAKNDVIFAFDVMNHKCSEIPLSLILLQNRYGHSSSVYNNEIYIFGGKRYYTKTFDFSEPPTDTLLYILSPNGSGRQIEGSGDIRRARVFQSSIIHKDKMYIAGGYVDATRYSNSSYCLDLK